MSNSIRKLLEKPDVKSVIMDAVSSFWTTFAYLRANPDYFDSLQVEALTNVGRTHTLNVVQSVWREKIAPMLRSPVALTIRDVRFAVKAQFLNTGLDRKLSYERFVDFLESTSTIQRSCGPIRVAIGGFGFDATEQTPLLIWTSDTGFRVTFLGYIVTGTEHPADDQMDGRFPVKYAANRAAYFRLEGGCTKSALRSFQRETCRVMRYAFRSNSLITSYDLRYLRDVEILRAGQQVEKRMEPEARLELAPLLDAYFSNPTKKDSIDRRVRNALHLVLQAESQNHTAIGIALSVAAIEALVCKDGGSISNMFAENTAVILEPDPYYRNAAVEFFKRLYDARSKVLHGEILEHETAARQNARALAAAVLNAVLERRSFQRRAGVEGETPDDLINEMKKGKWFPGQLTGVSESPVRTLWGAPYKGPEPELEDA